MNKTKYIYTLFVAIPIFMFTQEHATLDVGSSVGQIGKPDSQVFIGYASSCSSTKGDTIYISDMQNAEVLACSKDGKLHFRIGRRGQGPGEFQRPECVIWSNGHLYVSDTRMNRISIFMSDGTYEKTIRIQGVPKDMEVIGSRLFVGVMSPTNIVFAVNMNDAEDQTTILTYNHTSLASTPMMKRLSQPILNIIGDKLYVAMPNIGCIFEIYNNNIVKSYEPKNEWTESYWNYVDEIERRGDRGSITPTVFDGITTWQNKYLLIQFRNRQLGNLPSTAVVLNASSGAEVGPRIIAASSGFFHLTELPNGLFAWALNGEAMVYLFDFSTLSSYYSQNRRLDSRLLGN